MARTDTRSESEKLVERAIRGDRRTGPVSLTRTELDILWTMANTALHQGPYHVAFAATEALLCQADLRQNVCADMLPDVRQTALGKGTDPSILQSLVDRIESLNWQVSHR